jgi:hypothetical protein
MSNVGLFPVSYEITTGLMGAPTFTVHLVVNTPGRRVNGQGTVTNGSINPALNVPTTLEGDFTYMTVMPNETHILVVTNGSGPIGLTTPLEGPNTKLRMVLDSNWSAGTANFSYVDNNGKWQEVNDAKVTILQAVALPN